MFCEKQHTDRTQAGLIYTHLIQSDSRSPAVDTYMVLVVGPGAAQEQNLGALGVTVLTREVESSVSCLETECHHLLVCTRVWFFAVREKKN